MNEVVKIRKFNPVKQLPKSFTAIVVGPPKSGKTFSIAHLMYLLEHRYPTASVACGTEDSQGTFGDFCPKLFVNNVYDEEEQLNHVKRQKLVIREGGEPHHFEVIDDCSDDPKIYKSKLMVGAFKNGSQWWKRAFVMGMQYGQDFPPGIRKSVSFVILFREPEPNEREKLYKNFGGICGTYKNFCDLMDQFTGDHQCLVIVKQSLSNNLEDCIFWWKADGFKHKDGSFKPYPEGWKYGCDEYKEWHKKRYNKNYVEKDI